ncbi:hypothetical protein AVEN_98778-1 [Araneus ventricosus]|uniref:Tc1-like transposase DDE domain-containing protein n=1 Tax=Araneus ventricosus TaxID=182803 RepID=A0A4Y2LAN3_ARAVE|nr:hypothetical protein AVEN_98778-1 [Araneus ventricosus]
MPVPVELPSLTTFWKVRGLGVLSGLNPIENFWDALGRDVRRRFPPPATLRDLETALQEEWRLLDSAVVHHLVTSMITRCTLCMKVRGAHIPY